MDVLRPKHTLIVPCHGRFDEREDVVDDLGKQKEAEMHRISWRWSAAMPVYIREETSSRTDISLASPRFGGAGATGNFPGLRYFL